MDSLPFDLSASSPSSADEHWSPASTPIPLALNSSSSSSSHQEMHINDRLSNRKKRSLETTNDADYSSDEEEMDGEEGEGGSDGEGGEGFDHHSNNSDDSFLMSVSTAKSSRTRRVVGLAMSRLTELEKIKQHRKLTSEENREYKKLKRQRQNRDAAANSRKKKKQRMDSLEEIANGFKKQNEDLLAKLNAVLKENAALKQSLEALNNKFNNSNNNIKEEASSSSSSSSIIISTSGSSPSPAPCLSPPSSSIVHVPPSTAAVVGAIRSINNHSVEEIIFISSIIINGFGLLWPRKPLCSGINADGMIVNEQIVLPPAPVSVPIIAPSTTEIDMAPVIGGLSMNQNPVINNNNTGINDVDCMMLQNAYQQFQFASMMEGLFQTMDNNIGDLSHMNNSSSSNSSFDLSSSSSEGLFDQSSLIRSSSLSSVAAKDLSFFQDNNASIDSAYGFAPISSAF